LSQIRIAGQKILVAEDDTLQAMFLQEALVGAGCCVIGPVASLSAALNLIESGNLDAAVLDIRLGATDCFAVAAALCERGTPFLFLSGYPATRVPYDLRDRPYLDKPISVEELLRTLAELLLNPRRSASLRFEEVRSQLEPAPRPL